MYRKDQAGAVRPTTTVQDAGTHRQSERADHACFGLVRVSRVSSNGMRLFGSALVHQNHIEVEVSRAHSTRGRSGEHISADEGVVRFGMSLTQWADMLTSTNMGAGTPVTLTRAPERGTRLVGMPMLQADPLRSTHAAAIRGRAREASAKVKEVQDRLRQFLEVGAKAPSKKEVEALLNELNAAGSHFEAGAELLQEDFIEAMDKATVEAKAAVNAHAQNVVLATGIQAVKSGQLLQIDDGTE